MLCIHSPHFSGMSYAKVTMFPSLQLVLFRFITNLTILIELGGALRYED